MATSQKLKLNPGFCPEEMDILLGREDTRMDMHPTKKKRRPRFFCGAILYRWNPKSKIFEVVVIDYHEDGIGPLQIKFVGGCSEWGETPFQTACKEVLEEAGITLRKETSKNVLHTKVMQYPNAHAYSECAKFEDFLQTIEHMHFIFIQEMPFYEGVTPFLKTKTGSDKNDVTQKEECTNVRWEPLTQSLVNKIHRSHKEPMQKTKLFLLNNLNPADGEDVKRQKLLALSNLYF